MLLAEQFVCCEADKEFLKYLCVHLKGRFLDGQKKRGNGERRSTKAMGIRTVKNYPSPRLMETIGATNQTPAEAIGELVANCFDARYGDEKLDVTIDMRSGKIAVIDNGKGMTDDILEKSVCIAEDMSRYLERGENAKGHFGMGFKTSCSTLGRFYEIYTRPANRKIEYHTSFDISEYSIRPSGADAWDVKIEDSERFATSPLASATHGTAFVIKNLRKDKGTSYTSAVLTYLGEAFKPHLEHGDRIVVIDESGESREAMPKPYNFVKGTKIDINETFGEGDKYHITGWMALDSHTHNDGLYGFNIYRHDQLVVKFDKTWFTAHLMTSRVIGEVNMDFLEATFYKQGVQQSQDWLIVSTHMKEYLRGIVSASRDISRKGNINDPSERKKIVSKLLSDYGINDSNVENDTAGSAEEKKEKRKKSGINDNIKSVVNEEGLSLEGEGDIMITYLEKSNSGNVQAPFDYIFAESDDEDKAELQVILFADHPLWRKKVDDSVRRIIATSDAIYRMLVEKFDYDTYNALKIRNEWLNKRIEG